MVELICHPEQSVLCAVKGLSELAEGIWASRAKRRVLCDALIALGSLPYHRTTGELP
jgi:hypothetical protein